MYLKIIRLFYTIDETEPGFAGGIFYDMVHFLNSSFIDNANVYLLIALLIWSIVAFQKQNFISNSPVLWSEF